MPKTVKLLSQDEGFNINEEDIKQALTRAVPDRVAHIRHARLNDSHEWGLHVSEIFDRVACHVHFHGNEVYEIICGSGELFSSEVEVEGDLAQIVKIETMQVFPGDVFSIPEGVAHQLVRRGNGPLIIIFACPDSHTGDDRLVLPDICRGEPLD